jgi:hypothetical protein
MATVLRMRSLDYGAVPWRTVVRKFSDGRSMPNVAVLVAVALACATAPAFRAERERNDNPAGAALDTTKLDGFLARACGEWSEGEGLAEERQPAM